VKVTLWTITQQVKQNFEKSNTPYTKIIDKLSTMKSKFDNSNFAFMKLIKKLEKIYDTLSGK
jgi:uncharacterized protein YpuA (DUF1002 family)